MSLELGLNTFGDVTADEDGRPRSQAQTIRDVIEEGVLADRVGIDCFGVGEHHRDDFAISAPEVVLALIAARTRRIRLGSAVTVLSCDDPVRVFQRFSTLAAAAPSRVEVIVGRGAFTEPFPLFGFELSQYSALFQEKLDLLVSLLRRDSVTWRGTLRPSLTDQRVYPRLESRPLRTWVAVGSTPESVLRAAQYDLPLMLGIVGGEPERFRVFVDLYRQAFAKLGLPVQPIGVHSPGYVADSDEQARREFWGAYQPHRDRIAAERGLPPITQSQFDNEVERGSLYVGSPQTVAARITATLRALGASRFDLKYSTGHLGHRKLMRCVELFGSAVVPLVRASLR